MLLLTVSLGDVRLSSFVDVDNVLFGEFGSIPSEFVELFTLLSEFVVVFDLQSVELGTATVGTVSCAGGCTRWLAARDGDSPARRLSPMAIARLTARSFASLMVSFTKELSVPVGVALRLDRVRQAMCPSSGMVCVCLWSCSVADVWIGGLLIGSAAVGSLP